MIGHGCPSNRLGASARAAFAARLVMWRCALLLALWAVLPNEILLGQTTQTKGWGVRIVWGGGEPVTWIGSISVSAGEFDRLVPLGLSRDDNATVRLEGSKLLVRQWLPGTYNGCDIRVLADQDAILNLEFSSRENSATHFTRQVKLKELIAGPLTIPLDAQRNRISLMRSPGDELQVDFDQDHLVFETESSTRLRVTPLATGFSPSAEGKLRIFTRASGTEKSLSFAESMIKSDAQGEILPVEPITVTLPEVEGVYDWDIVLVENQKRGVFNSEKVVRARRVQYVVLSKSPPEPPAAQTWQEAFAIDPTWPERWTMRRQMNQIKLPTRYPPLLSNGASVEQVNKQSMTRLVPKGWQAIALPIDQPNVPHLLEIEYLASKPLALGVSILEPNGLGVIPAIGIDSGIRVPSSTIQSGTSNEAVIERHQLTFWPSTKLPYLILANHDENNDAIYGRVRVLSGPPRLPPIQQTAIDPPNGRLAQQAIEPARPVPMGRQRMLFLERPTFAQAMNAPQVLDDGQNQLLDDWTTIYQGADRLIQYLKANGYSGLVMTVAADGSAIFPSDRLRPTPRWDAGSYFSTGQDGVRKDVLQLLFRLFARAGLQLIPVIEFSGRLPMLESQRDASQASGLDLVSVEGRLWRSEPAELGRPPYNPLNPRVQVELAQQVEELAERYARFDSFGGVAIGLNQRSILAFPDATWGWDEASVKDFVTANGISPSAFKNASTADAGREFFERHRRTWLQWRGQRIASLFLHFEAAVQKHSLTAKLFAIPIDESSNVIPIRSIAEAIDVNSSFDPLNQMGIDAAALRSCPGIIVLDGIAAGHLESAAPTASFRASESEISDNNCAGVLFEHSSSWAHFEQFEKQNPLTVSAPIVRMQQLTPAGQWNRRRYAAAFALADRMYLLDGGATIAQGQEGATTNWSAVLRALPQTSVETVVPPTGDFELPLVMRQHRAADGSYFYAVNHSPWPLEVEIDLDGESLDTLAWLSGQSPASTTNVKLGRIKFDLPAFEIAAASFQGSVVVRSYRAHLPNQSVNRMQRELQELKAKLANVEPGAAKSLLENPSFEASENGQGLQGWQVEPGKSGRIELAYDQAYDGGSALMLESNGEAISARSNPFAAPPTGRISVSAWVRSDEANPPPIRFVVEAGSMDQFIHRFSELGQRQETASSQGWRQFIAHFDELPMDSRELRVGFDVSSAGIVRIDRVEIHDRWLDQGEVQSLKQLLNLASFKLQEQGDAVGCLRILESYWPRFVDDQFQSAVESARLPETPAASKNPLK